MLNSEDCLFNCIFYISSQHLWQKLLQDRSQCIFQAQLLDLSLQSSLQGYVPP
jgi:hypothetical protein